MRTKPFRPVRPLKSFDSVYPEPFDPRQSTFIPQESVSDEHVRDVDARKVKLYAAKVYRATAQTIADITDTELSFSTTEYDEGGFWSSTSPTRLTVPFSGVYSITGYAAFDGNATGIRKLRLLVSGTATIQDVRVTVGAATETPCSIAAALYLTASTYLQLQVRQNSGGDLDVRSGNDDNFFAIAFLGEI